MNITAEKLVSSFLIAFISLVFGYLPLILDKKYDFSNIDTTQPLLMKKEKKNRKNVILSFLMNLGGGVLLANCFCHWLPEVREGLENIDTYMPLAEVIMLSGFFFISGLEELIHHCLHPHHVSEDEHSLYGSVFEQEEISDDWRISTASAKIKDAIRVAFTVSALSFHSIIEGFVLGIEEDSAGVWMTAAATSLHKFVMAFSVGIELISNKASLTVYNIYTLIFGFAGVTGSIIGTIITNTISISESYNLPLQVLQGIASGVIVYVVFFEIFPKAKLVGGTGTQHILAMILGFLIFLPPIYFHALVEHGEEEHGGEVECPSLDVLQKCFNATIIQA